MYPIRHHGEKRPREVILSEGVRGHLAVWGNVFDRTITAELLAYLRPTPSGGEDVLPPLSKVRLLQVRSRGFLLWGTEHVRYLDHKGRPATSVYSQGWWCVPVLSPAPATA